MDDDDDDGGGGGGGNSRGSLPHWHTNPQPLMAIGFQTQIYIYISVFYRSIYLDKAHCLIRVDGK